MTKNCEASRRWYHALSAEDKERIYERNRKRRKERQRAGTLVERKHVWAWETRGNVASRVRDTVVAFDLSSDHIESLCGDVCPVFGTELKYLGSDRSISAHVPSLDRIVPAFGYVEGNVCVISKRANTIKNNATALELAQVTEYVYRQTPLDELIVAAGQY